MSSHALRKLHESIVTEQEIDTLGHMNVRHYGERALAATNALLESLLEEGGLAPAEPGQSGPPLYDVRQLFTRYHREQLAGAPLEVRGGVLAAGADAIRLYHELVNPAREEVAAAFVHDVVLLAPETNEPIEVPDALRKDGLGAKLDWPDYGRARTLDLDAAPVGLDMREAIEGGLAIREGRRITADECDADGRMSADVRPFLMWGGEPIPPNAGGPPVLDLENGGRMGWATLENRSVMVGQPVAGMRIQSFAATVEIARKTTLRRYWVFDLDRGDLLMANEVVDLALHLDLRRSMEIPADIRQRLEAAARLDLR